MCLFHKGYATMGLFTKICTFVISLRNKNFLIQRSNYTMEVYLVLYELFVSKMGLKRNCLIDFFTTSLPTTHVNMHAHCCSLLKLYTKLELVIDCFMQENVNCLMKLNGL